MKLVEHAALAAGRAPVGAGPGARFDARLEASVACVRRRTAVAVNVFTGLAAVGLLLAVGGASGALDRRRAPDPRALGALFALHEAQLRFCQLDPDRDGRADSGTLAELDRAGLIDAALRGHLVEADHAYEAFVHPTAPTRWLMIAHPLRRDRLGYAIDERGRAFAFDDDVVGDASCDMPRGCWMLGK